MQTPSEGQLMLAPSVQLADVIPIARQDMYRPPAASRRCRCAIVVDVVVVSGVVAAPPCCRRSLRLLGRRRSLARPRLRLRQKSLNLSHSQCSGAVSIAYGEAIQISLIFCSCHLTLHSTHKIHCIALCNAAPLSARPASARLTDQ